MERKQSEVFCNGIPQSPQIGFVATANFVVDFVSQQHLIVDRNTVQNLPSNSSGHFLQVSYRQQTPHYVSLSLENLFKKKKIFGGKKTQNAKNMWRPTLSSLLSKRKHCTCLILACQLTRWELTVSCECSLFVSGPPSDPGSLFSISAQYARTVGQQAEQTVAQQPPAVI